MLTWKLILIKLLQYLHHSTTICSIFWFLFIYIEFLFSYFMNGWMYISRYYLIVLLKFILYLILWYFLQPWLSRAYDPCTERYSNIYYNLPEVQMALHANTTGIQYPWKTCRFLLLTETYTLKFCLFFKNIYIHLAICCSDIVGTYWADSPKSMLPIYHELIAAGMRIWVFR